MSSQDLDLSIAARKRQIITQLTKIVSDGSFLTPIIALDVDGVWSVDHKFSPDRAGFQISKSNPKEIAQAVEILSRNMNFYDWIDSAVAQ